jgi:hypothetical protein
MRKTIGIALALGLLLAPASALAQQVPDLKGTWKGMNEAVVSGGGPHHREGTQAEPRTSSQEVTMTVTGQEGRRFWGEFASATDKEPVLGIIGGDGSSIYMADPDGHILGSLTEDGQLDLCYLRAGSDLAVAACALLTKE